jgi:ATP-dependent Clp protease, protease subunit
MFTAMNKGIVACLVTLLLFVSASPLVAQQPSNPQTVIITFVGGIDTNSVTALLRVVSEQTNRGAKKVILLISSPGGDTSAAFTAYNILRHMPIELTTFNTGAVDSAGMLIYCAGRNRYSFPGARFLIHGNSLQGTGAALPGAYTAAFLETEVHQLNSLNQMIVQVVTEAANKKAAPQIAAAVQSERILTPEEAKEWGIVQDVRQDYMEPGAVMVSGNSPASVSPPDGGNPSPYTSASAPASANVKK